MAINNVYVLRKIEMDHKGFKMKGGLFFRTFFCGIKASRPLPHLRKTTVHNWGVHTPAYINNP